METLLLVGKVVFSLFAFANIVTYIYCNRNRLDFGWSIWKSIKVEMVLESLGVMILTIGIGVLLVIYVPFMGMGWSNLFFEHGGNLLLAPIVDALQSTSFCIRLIVPLSLLIFLVVIPFMAYSEELIFRKGYHQWPTIFWQSVKFGFVHMIVGVPLAAGVVLSGVGLFYAYKYKQAYEISPNNEIMSWFREESAVLVATTYHTIYNALVVIGMLIIALMNL